MPDSVWNVVLQIADERKLKVSQVMEMLITLGAEAVKEKEIVVLR